MGGRAAGERRKWRQVAELLPDRDVRVGNGLGHDVRGRTPRAAPERGEIRAVSPKTSPNTIRRCVPVCSMTPGAATPSRCRSTRRSPSPRRGRAPPPPRCRRRSGGSARPRRRDRALEQTQRLAIAVGLDGVDDRVRPPAPRRDRSPRAPARRSRRADSSPKARRPHRVEVRAARDERHLVARSRELRSVVTADGARPDNGEPHRWSIVGGCGISRRVGSVRFSPSALVPARAQAQQQARVVQGAQGSIRRAAPGADDRDDRTAGAGLPNVRARAGRQPEVVALPRVPATRGSRRTRRRSRRTSPPSSPAAAWRSTMARASTSRSRPSGSGSAAACMRPRPRSCRSCASTSPPPRRCERSSNRPGSAARWAVSKARVAADAPWLPEGSSGRRVLRNRQFLAGREFPGALRHERAFIRASARVPANRTAHEVSQRGLVEVRPRQQQRTI